MRRREALATLGLFGLAGCLAPSSGNSGDTTTEDEPTTTTSKDTTTTEVTTTTPDGGDWSADLTPVGIECASEDVGDASVAFHEDRVEITGTIVGADMCYVPRLDRVALDEMGGELVVVVASFRDGDEDTACAQCLAAIEYAVDVTFTGGLPSRVVVKHAADGSEETVTTASS